MIILSICNQVKPHQSDQEPRLPEVLSQPPLSLASVLYASKFSYNVISSFIGATTLMSSDK